MQVLLALRFYHPLIKRIKQIVKSTPRVKNGRKDEQCSYSNSWCVQVYTAYSFRVRKYPVLKRIYPLYSRPSPPKNRFFFRWGAAVHRLKRIQRIHLRCGSFGSIISFFFRILVKKRNVLFWLKIRIWVSVQKGTHTEDSEPGRKKKGCMGGQGYHHVVTEKRVFGNLFFLSIQFTLFIPSFNVLSCYFNVLLNLVASLTVWI